MVPSGSSSFCPLHGSPMVATPEIPIETRLNIADRTDEKSHPLPQIGKKGGNFLGENGTRGGNRTHTPLREQDFESSASANSATLAFGDFLNIDCFLKIANE